MCVTGFPRDAPANGGIGAGIDQLLRPRRFLVDSHDLRQQLVDRSPSKRTHRVAFNDGHGDESASKPAIIQRITDVRVTVRAPRHIAVAI